MAPRWQKIQSHCLNQWFSTLTPFPLLEFSTCSWTRLPFSPMSPDKIQRWKIVRGSLPRSSSCQHKMACRITEKITKRSYKSKFNNNRTLIGNYYAYICNACLQLNLSRTGTKHVLVKLRNGREKKNNNNAVPPLILTMTPKLRTADLEEKITSLIVHQRPR